MLDFCLDTSTIWGFIGYILMAIKIIIPILIIVLGIIDFAKVVTSNDDKAIKIASTGLIKRLILGIAIFFIPSLVSLVFSMVKEAAPVLERIEECQVCLLRPTSNECTSYKEQAKRLRNARNEVK